VQRTVILDCATERRRDEEILRRFEAFGSLKEREGERARGRRRDRETKRRKFEREWARGREGDGETKRFRYAEIWKIFK
jgi:hypothetical protein